MYKYKSGDQEKTKRDSQFERQRNERNEATGREDDNRHTKFSLSLLHRLAGNETAVQSSWCIQLAMVISASASATKLRPVGRSVGRRTWQFNYTEPVVKAKGSKGERGESIQLLQLLLLHNGE